MKKNIFISIYFLYSVFSSHAIDIKLIADYPRPSEEKFIESFGKESENRKFTYPRVGGVGKTNLVFGLRPYYFNLDIKTGEYLGLSELYEKIGKEYTYMYEFGQNDYLYFSYGEYGPSADRYFGMYSLEHGWKDFERREQVIARKQGNMSFSPPREGMVGYWEKHLFGPYVLVPRPEITDIEELMRMDTQALVSLKNMQTENLTPLPKELDSIRNMGESYEVSVSFDRFKIAIFGMFGRKTPDDPLHFDERVYILDVIYDGTLLTETSFRAEPGTNGEILAVLPANTPLLVTDTAQYEQREDGKEDFWYKVNTESQSGWVFGGDLLIEGDDWKVRLKTRGRPVEWEDLDYFLDSSGKYQAEEETKKEDSIVEEVEATTEIVEAPLLHESELQAKKIQTGVNKKKINKEWLRFGGIALGVILLALVFILFERKRD